MLQIKSAVHGWSLYGNRVGFSVFARNLDMINTKCINIKCMSKHLIVCFATDSVIMMTLPKSINCLTSEATLM